MAGRVVDMMKAAAARNAAEISRTLKGDAASQLGAAGAKALEQHLERGTEDAEVVEQVEASAPAVGGATLGESMALLQADAARVEQSAAERGLAAFLDVMSPDRVRTEVELATLRDSPTNPRKTFAGIVELSKSLQALGCLQPILVRRVEVVEEGNVVDVAFELIAGRRRVAAAREAGLLKLPAEVLTVTDAQAVEVQIAENVQREGLSPLEEAEGYDWLLRTVGMTVEQIATKLGVTKATVYGRLRLLELSPKCREALAEGKIPMSLGVPLSRAGRHAEQEIALRKILGRAESNGGEVHVRNEIIWLAEEFSRSMKSPPFNPRDPMLVTGEPACTECPRRTSNMPKELFDTKHPPDVCTVPKCFEAKSRAAWAAKAAKAKEEGARVLGLEEGARLFRHETLGPDSDLVELGTPNTADSKRRTWDELLEKLPAEKRPQVVVAPDRGLKARRLMSRKELTAALAEETGAKWAVAAVEATPKRKPKASDEKPDEKKARAVREKSAMVAIARIGSAVTKPGAPALGLPVWRIIYEAISSAASYNAEAFAVLEVKSLGELDKRVKAATKASEVIRPALILAMLSAGHHEAEDGYADELRALAKLYGVDLGSVETAVTRELDAEAVLKGGKG